MELLSFVNGEFSTIREHSYLNTNPATGSTINTVFVSTGFDINAAVETCKMAQKDWAKRSPTQRGRILHNIAQRLRKDLNEFARIECQDTGKPIAEAQAVDIPSAADCLEYFAGLAPTLCGDSIPLGQDQFALTHRIPFGVCAGIGAWNYPLQILCWKLAPALICGNGMVFKPSEQTPSSALAFAKMCVEEGLPPGLFNIVLGASEVGQALISHPGVAKISVTGSVATGQKIASLAGSLLKPVTLELGGKSPILVFADCDLALASTHALEANFFTQGEICSNGTRVFVAQEIYDDFIKLLLEKTSAWQVGNPIDPKTKVGSLINKSHMKRVMQYIEFGKKEGATLLAGGHALTYRDEDGFDFSLGCFIEPTIFVNCQDDMRIVQEEIFGPVMTVLRFKDEQEVIDRANKSIYGLGAGVFTNHLARAHRVSQALEAGIVWINSYNATPVEIPFGGVKSSGQGRENGAAALDSYSQIKTVYFSLATR